RSPGAESIRRGRAAGRPDDRAGRRALQPRCRDPTRPAGGGARIGGGVPADADLARPRHSRAGRMGGLEMKVAVAGKGGVGKTTVSAFLARCWRDLGYEVVAVDADPDANLAGTLGYRGPDITPLVKLKALIEERVGGGEGWGGFLKMNPRVDDIP